MKIVALIIAFLTLPEIALAQEGVDTTFQVELTGTASPMFNFFRSPRVPGTVTDAAIGYGFSLRGMWHPSRLLSFGILTGYYVFCEDEFSVDPLLSEPSVLDLTYRARLSAIPIQLALSMQASGTEIGMGIGPYVMMSTIQGGSSPRVDGSRLELGMTFFGSHVFALTDRLSIGPELRILYFRYRGILSIVPSCTFRFDAIRY